ncbi:uncharacterized protein [Muntiacus reevesi]|uniref:uncharacterized protein n=1 Tax=Muntiacus reevesi TaxID=9886 RepID=UPI003306A208
MLRAPRPGPHASRGRVSDCSPLPERRPGALNRGPWDPTPPAPPARRRARSCAQGRARSRPHRRPPPPRRPRIPTPRAGRRAPPARPRRPRPEAAQCAAPPASVAQGNRRTRDRATGGAGARAGPGEHRARLPPNLEPGPALCPRPAPGIPGHSRAAPDLAFPRNSRPAQPSTSESETCVPPTQAGPPPPDTPRHRSPALQPDTPQTPL